MGDKKAQSLASVSVYYMRGRYDTATLFRETVMRIFYMPILLAALIVFCGCAKTAPVVPDKPAPPGEDFEIQYNMPLTQIHVLPGKADYQWYTHKPEARQQSQRLEYYNAHFATITPNPEELAALRAWLKKYDFAGFKKDYPPRNPQSYPAAWHESLSVRIGNTKYHISWTGDSECPPELDKAVDELEDILKRATESEKPAPAGTEFEIQYSFAGLTKIHVLPGKVDYEWHTLKPEYEHHIPPQKPTAYDTHTATITPNEEELAALRAWLKKYDFAGFKADYPRGENAGYAAEWRHSLVVRDGDKKYSITWTDGSAPPAELTKAVEELQDILKRARESETPAQTREP